MAFVTKFNNLSNNGEANQANFAIAVNKAHEQLKSLGASSAYSTNEKKNIASKSALSTRAAIEKQISSVLNHVFLEQESVKSATKRALTSDWSSSAQAIVAIELSKDGKRAISSLTDKNSLTALASLPEAITGLSKETLDNARNAYVMTNHPEIQKSIDNYKADLLLVDSMLKINEDISSSYKKYSSAEIETITAI